MGLNHKLQCQILEYLQPFYGRGSSDIKKQDFVKHTDYDANLKYLYDAKFITGNNIKQIGTTNLDLHNISITKTGLDFLKTSYNQSKPSDNQGSDYIKDKQKDTPSDAIYISHSTVTIGDKNKIHSQSSQNNTTQTTPAQTATIKKILIEILVAVVGGLILWYLTK
jgi:hypothetical protein